MVVIVVHSHCLLQCKLPVQFSLQQRKWNKQWYSVLFFLVCDSSAKVVICSLDRDKKITAASGVGDLY